LEKPHCRVCVSVWLQLAKKKSDYKHVCAYHRGVPGQLSLAIPL